ncbi:hypothetical protein AsAng_0054830 [Aureispira anguillae]|uniref:Uncharacterized protein n=1 Tax=Aureispira anguillae TaxID=2864201 RepID=A0A915YK44_9BACT|nr:hypothetical protein AsAng_0054830 [Aureispira anguillae]
MIPRLPIASIQQQAIYWGEQKYSFERFFDLRLINRFLKNKKSRCPKGKCTEM